MLDPFGPMYAELIVTEFEPNCYRRVPEHLLYAVDYCPDLSVADFWKREDVYRRGQEQVEVHRRSFVQLRRCCVAILNINTNTCSSRTIKVLSKIYKSAIALDFASFIC